MRLIGPPALFGIALAIIAVSSEAHPPRPGQKPTLNEFFGVIRGSSCKAEQLSIKNDQNETDEISGGLGHGAVTIAIHNQSSSTCTFNGVPAIVLLNADGKRLPIQFCEGCEDYLFRRQPARLIELHPGQSAYVVFGYDINDGNGRCSEANAATLEMKVSGDNRRLRTAVGRWRSCGQVNVTPFLAKPAHNGFLPDPQGRP
jgi:Protein of unknown function (DUF4232)